MAEARRLKTGKWRIYSGPELEVTRDPQTGAIVYFDSLETARGWWDHHHPGDRPLREANKCARCGAYFGPLASYTVYGETYYHPQHTPQAIDVQRRR
jgi:hypothetical protein